MATAATFPKMEDPNPDETRPPVLSERAAASLLGANPQFMGEVQAQEAGLRESNLRMLEQELSAEVRKPGGPNPTILAALQSERANLMGEPQQGGMPPAPGGMMPPAIPPGGGPSLRTTTPQIQSLERQQQAFQQQSNARLQELSHGRDVAAQGAIDAFKEKMPARPELGPLPKYEAQPYSQENALAFGAIATAFAALAGLRTRAPLTAAMNAAGQAMQGYTTGRLIEVNTELNTFRTQFNSALASNEQMLKEYQSIINDRNLTRAEKMAEWQVAAARWKDEATMAMMRNNQYDLAIHRLYTSLEGANKLAQQADQFEKGLRNKIEVAQINHPQAPLAGQELDEAGKTALDIQAWNFLTSKTLPYRKGSGGGADRNDVVVRRAGEIANSLQMTPEEVSSMPAEWKANAGSLLMQTKKLDAIGAQLQSFHNNLDTWNSLAQGITPQIGGDKVRALAPLLERINFTGVQSIDDVKLRIQQQTNDPTVNAYLIAAMAAAMDYARIMSGPQSAAQLTEGARHDAERLIRAGADDNARIGIMAALESDTEGQRKGLESQVQVTRQRMSRRTGSTLAPSGGGLPSPKSKEEYDALPAGSQYIGSDGKTRVKGNQ